MNDTDSVEILQKRKKPAEETQLTTLGWTAERDLLTSIVEVLAHIHATLIQVHSKEGKRPDVEPLRRPHTIVDRVEARQAWEEHRERVSKMLPAGR
jgi:hypothetical protein